MTFPSFSVGEVLRAEDMNAVGLWKISTTNVGTGVSSVTLSNCFTSEFTNYRVLIHGVQTSTSMGLMARLGSTTTGYYGNFVYALFTATAFTFVPMNNSLGWYVALSDNSGPHIASSFDVFQPQLAAQSFYTGSYYGRGYMGNFGGFLGNLTSYSDLTIYNESGTMTGGQISVYGYRK